MAAVTWLGYQAPQMDTIVTLNNSVAGSRTAKQGGQDLAAFLTAIGHSYGSTTAGYGVQNVASGVVDRAIFYGSPGLGTNDVSDLQVPRNDLYVLEAKNDPVADLGRFGQDANQLPVTHLQTSASTAPDGTPLKESTGHSAYLDDETTSQHNMAAVLADQPGQTITGTNEGFGDELRERLGYPGLTTPNYGDPTP